MINGPLLLHTWRSQRSRVAIVMAGLALWSFLMPVVYATFGREMAAVLDTGIIPEAFLGLMGSNPFSLDGVIGLGVVHPFAIALLAVFPVGYGAASVAGERQRGTLEVLLARPVSRRSLVITTAVALLGIVVATTAAMIAGFTAGATLYGLAGDLDPGELLFLSANVILLFAALGSLALVVSTTFDRLAPAAGIAFAIVLVGYVLEILGTLWPDAEFLQPISPLHYLQPAAILDGRGSTGDLLVLGAVTIAALGHILFWFPRRDLPAPT